MCTNMGYSLERANSNILQSGQKVTFNLKMIEHANIDNIWNCGYVTNFALSPAPSMQTSNDFFFVVALLYNRSSHKNNKGS